MPLAPRPPLIKRLRPGHWLLLDCSAAALYALVAWGSLALAATVLVSVPIAVGRRHPMAAFAILLVATWLGPVTDTPELPVWALAPMACVLFLVAVGHRAGISIIVLALSFSGPVATALPGFVHKGAVIPFSLVYVTIWAVGYAVGQHRRYGEELLRHHARLAGVEMEKARRGVTEERIRIARELHDVVAHSMSVITVQAGFGHLVIDDKPAEARAALGAIETTGREALAEMRRLLGVLREEDLVALTPAPGLADLDRLVEQTAKAGVRADLRITGAPRDLPAGIELSAYRIVQEALTNVVKHSGAPHCQVTVDVGPDELAIEVTDDGPAVDGHGLVGPAVDGHGLVGMRERVSLYGGRFDAGPLPERGFRVTAWLPTGACGVA
jgi:signal transduction histidine kinase